MSNENSRVDSISTDHRTRRTFLKIAGAGSVISISGCLGDDDDDDAAPSDDDDGADPADDSDDDGLDPADQIPETVIGATGSPAHPLYWSHFIPGFRDGMADNYGVDADIATYSGFTAVVAGLFQEEVHLAHITAPAIANAINEEIPLVAPMGFVQQFAFPMLVGPDVEDFSDLEGEDIAVHSPSSMSAGVGRQMIVEELGSLDSVNVVNILGTPSRVAAIESGEVAGSATSLAGAMQAERDGIGHILAYPWDYDSLAGHVPNAYCVMSDNWDDNREMIGLMVEQLLAGHEYMYELDPGYVADEVIESNINAPYDRQTIVDAIDIMQQEEMWPRDGGLDPEAWELTMDLFTDTGVLDEGARVSADEFVVDDYLS